MEQQKNHKLQMKLTPMIIDVRMCDQIGMKKVEERRAKMAVWLDCIKGNLHFSTPNGPIWNIPLYLYMSMTIQSRQARERNWKKTGQEKRIHEIGGEQINIATRFSLTCISCLWCLCEFPLFVCHTVLFTNEFNGSTSTNSHETKTSLLIPIHN